ncbi:alpha/beta hydrolase [Actinomycetes bacterium KLBMP 9759]
MTSIDSPPTIPLDPELAAMAPVLLERFAEVQNADLAETRVLMERFRAERSADLDTSGVEIEELTVPGPAGDPDIALTVVRPRERAADAPGIYSIHGGGMVIGSRLDSVPELVQYATEHGVVGVSVEYRLAPEHPDPAPVEDSYAGLVWTAANAARLGIDPERLIVMGGSAGGGLAAGVTLLARDRGGPGLAGSVLICPMIDDRDATLSTRQHEEAIIWNRAANRAGWDALLGGRRGGSGVSIYAAPARATDLSGLPPTFLDTGSAEVFRDEVVEYASKIWAAGGRAELHVWAGGFHGFDGLAAPAAISTAAREAREAWIRRTLGL